MAPGLPARTAVVCALFLGVGAARAERRPVAVVDLAAIAPTCQLADALNSNALFHHIDLRPLPNAAFAAALIGPFEDEDRPYLIRAREAHTDAQAAIDQLEYDRAVRDAARGMRELANVRPTPDMLGLYAELAFTSGFAELRLRRPNDASGSFQLAFRLDPGRQPDPARYEPDVIEAYRAAAAKPAIPARLVIAGAGRAWIDGVEAGPAPGIFAVSEGLHLVQLSGADRETRGEQVRVPDRAEIEIAPAPATEDLKVRRARLALARAPDATARAGAMKRLAELLGVGDAVLLWQDAPGPVRIQTWRDREPGFSAMVERTEEKPIDLLAPLAPPRKDDPPRVVRPPVELPPLIETPWHERTWVRATAVTGVVAAIVTAVLIARHRCNVSIMQPEWD
jgi:hypothetical protein